MGSGGWGASVNLTCFGDLSWGRGGGIHLACFSCF